MTRGIINFVIKILEFFRIKKLEEKKLKLELELEKYQASSIYIKTHIKLIIKIVLLTYFQFLTYYSISFWVYKAFGFVEKNIFQIISMQAVLYGTVSGIPSPGAMGVTEGGYLEIFKSVYPKDMISGAMLINRGINFYLFVIITSIIVMYCTFRDKRELKEEKIETT